MENPQTTEQVSLRDALVEAIKQDQTKETENEQETNEPTEQEEAPAEEEATEGNDNQEQEDEEGVLEEDAEEDGEAEETAEKEFPLIPNNWSNEEKETFQKLIDSDDPDKRMAAEILLERYNSFKKTFFDKTKQYANETKEYKSINEVFQPVQHMMEANKVDKASYIKNMMQWEESLAKNPVQTVKAIMEKFNVKPEQLGIKRKYDIDLDEDEELTEPEYDAKKDIEELRTAIANQPLLAQIAQFANATDSSGKLLHPRFEEVKTIMGQIIQSKKATSLEDAYRKAVKVIDDEEVQTEDEPAVDLDKIRQKVKKAKKASKGVKSNGGKPDMTKMTIKEELVARLKQQ